MTDYGHELAFGSFLTPTAADPRVAVRLAEESEAAGLDLVTFQDHPYQPAFLDTWTLLTWVAAATHRVTVCGNVLNLPLRPPAVLARAVASLDLLTGGRAALGIGAGAFWQAIEAMGGRRLAPADAVAGVEQAIAIIRGIWDTSDRAVLRAGGAVHRVAGAKRGPAPAHRVPIWVGALGPRMLALIGQVADGWLPSLGRLGPGDLSRANAVIDGAARQAGRDPAEIRRLANVSGRITTTILAGGGPVPAARVAVESPIVGPVDYWAEQLSRLALEDGVSTFILADDDPVALHLFGAEVAPLVRERVAAARAEQDPGGDRPPAGRHRSGSPADAEAGTSM